MGDMGKPGWNEEKQKKRNEKLKGGGDEEEAEQPGQRLEHSETPSGGLFHVDTPGSCSHTSFSWTVPLVFLLGTCLTHDSTA